MAAAAKQGLIYAGYELLSELGRGYDATVFLASKQNKFYALKIPSQSQGPADYERIRREGYVLARLNHPQLPSIFEVGEVDGIPFLALEYIKGNNLSKNLEEQKKLPIDFVVKVAADLAKALHEIHRRNFVHRDVKPENVMLTDQGHLKLIDLGMAADDRIVERDAAREMVLGTLQYASPEQCGILKRRVDARSDLYSLGMTLYQLVTGELPFQTTDLAELLRMHSSVVPPSVTHLRPQMSPAFSQIIQKLIQKDPDDRYQTAMGLLSDIENIETFDHQIHQGLSVHLGRQDFAFKSGLQPLRGRDNELQLLVERTENFFKAQGGFTWIQAESGMGKSRLAQEMIDRCRKRGAIILHTKCNERAAALPFAALKEALDGMLLHLEQLQGEERQNLFSQIKSLTKGLETGLQKVVSSAFGKQFLISDLPQTSGLGAEQILAQAYDFINLLSQKGHAILFYLDDLQWADDLSLQFFSSLGPLLSERRIQIVATVRQENADQLRCREVLSEVLSSKQIFEMILGPLDRQGISDYILELLGGRPVDERILAKVQSASGGNPLLIQELTLALLNRGDVHFDAGSWKISETSLADLNLSNDVYSLILSRASRLNDEHLDVLKKASVLDGGFSNSQLQLLTGQSENSVQEALDSAHAINMIEVNSASELYHFVHDKIQEALRSSLELTEQKKLYGILALSLKNSDPLDTNNLIRRAQYLSLSNWQESASEAFSAQLKASQAMVQNYAFESAIDLLEKAREMMALAKPVPSQLHTFYTTLCLAQLKTGQLENVLEGLQQARTHAVGWLQLAHIEFLHANALSGQGNLREAWEKLKESLRTLGFSFPKSSAGQALQLLKMIVQYFTLSFFKLGYGRVTGKGIEVEIKKYELAGQMYELGTYLSYTLGDPFGFAYIGFSNYLNSQSLGDSPELAKSHMSLALLWGLFVVKPLMRFHIQSARRISSFIPDPGLKAFVKLQSIWCAEFSGQTVEAEKAAREFVPSTQKYLGSYVASQALTELAGQYLNRGMAREAIQFLNQYLGDIDRTQNLAMMANARGIYFSTGSLLGGIDDLSQRHEEWIQILGQIPSTLFSQVSRPGNTIIALVDQEDFGPKFEKLVQEFYDYKIEDHHFKIPHCLIAHARVAIYEKSLGTADEKAALQNLNKAIFQLMFRATIPLWKCHLFAVQAAKCRLRGQFKKAFQLLEKAEILADESGSHIGLFLVARERARLERTLGRPERMNKEAKHAMDLALKFSYGNRIKQIAREFELTIQSSPSDSGVTSHSAIFTKGSKVIGATSSDISLNQKRVLDALLRVSLASSLTLDPAEQVRSLLDEIIKVFGAERGLVLIWDEKKGQLVFRGGRDNNRNDMNEPQGYSRTIVRKVSEDQKPIVVTSADEMRDVGSQSAVVQDLRSILCVPLFLKEQFKGVLYIDSRLARGLFTKNDVDVLTAIANQIAITIESARLARVEAERREMKKDLELSAAVQNMLLPSTNVIQNENVTMAAFYKAAVQCSGDWWWCDQNAESMTFFVGDVTGHGAAPAMITACVASNVRILNKQNTNQDFKNVIEQVNEELWSIAQGNFLMSGMSLQYFYKTKTLKFWSAGAPFFFQLKLSGECVQHGDIGSPLGTKEFVLGSGHVQLEKGDRIVIVTDGILEIPVKNGRMLGERAFTRMLKEAQSVPIEKLHQHIEAKVTELVGDNPQGDDFTFVAFEIKS